MRANICASYRSDTIIGCRAPLGYSSKRPGSPTACGAAPHIYYKSQKRCRRRRGRALTPPQSPDTTETPASPPDLPTFRSPADSSPHRLTARHPQKRRSANPIIGEPRTVRRDHEQPMTNKTFQDILIEQLEAAAELGNADAMYNCF